MRSGDTGRKGERSTGVAPSLGPGPGAGEAPPRGPAGGGVPGSATSLCLRHAGLGECQTHPGRHLNSSLSSSETGDNLGGLCIQRWLKPGEWLSLCKGHTGPSWCARPPSSLRIPELWFFTIPIRTQAAGAPRRGSRNFGRRLWALFLVGVRGWQTESGTGR